MSTPETGDAAVAKAAVDQSRELLEQAAEQERQLELLSPEELAEARAELGPNAGGLSVVRHAREQRRGRPAGARNRRTDDFARYILGFGQDPAITLMQIQSTPTEVLMERSARQVTRVVGKGDSAKLVHFEETMSYQEAESLRIRCAEALMPFVHSKKPVAIDATIRGVRVVEEIGGSEPRDPIDGGVLRIAGPDEDLGEAA